MKKRKLASIVLSAALCVCGSAAVFSLVACSPTKEPEVDNSVVDPDPNNPGDDNPGTVTPDPDTPSQPDEKVSGKVNGTFYFEGSNEQENLLTLKDDLKFSLIVNGDVYTGSYTLYDSVLKLTSETDSWTGTYSADVVSLSYNNQPLSFIKKVSYTITFDVSGGTTIQSVSVVNGKSVEQPADPTRDGYVFLGWYEDSTYTSTYTFSHLITQDTTVYAKWAQKVTGQAEYTIDFDLGYSGATAIASVQTIGGKLYNEPAPTRDGYTFSGWAVSMYDSAEKISYMYDGNMVFAEDTTLHAVWTSNESSSKLAAPLVNVQSNLISWNYVSSTYNLKITGPDGFVAVDKNVGSTSEKINFAELPAGDYVITVTALASNTANNSTATVRYYLNKALDRVSAFEVVDPSVLSFNAVPNAQKYLISIECGNDSHTHTLVDNGSSTQYNFANCEMKAGGIKFTVTAVADGYANSVSRTFTYERKLGAISGFAFDDATQTLSWDAVASATSYEVKVVGAETIIYNIGNKTSFSLKNFDAVDGGLKISVTPKTYGYVSPDAADYTFKKANLASPTDVRISGDTLSWKAVTGATKYTISIGGQTFTSTTNSFNLREANTVTWTTGSDYSITVTANSDTVASSIASDVVDARYYALYSTMSYDNSTLTWRHVVGATKYEVAVNDGDPFDVTDGKNFADITLTKAGENTLSVRFYQGDTYSDWVSLSVYAYQIVFDSNGGSSPATQYKAVGDKIELPESTKTGYNFAGWYNVSGGADDNGAKFEQTTLENAKNLRLYAYFTSKEYTVTYVFGDDATGSKLTETVKFGKNYSLIVPTTTDGTKAFMGWSMYEDGSSLYTNEKGEGLSAWGIARDVTLYAYWSKQFSFQLTTVNGISGEVYSVSQGDAENMVGEITIPETYKGVQVAMIEANAFKNCNSLTVINIPNTVQLISSATPFDGCDSLTAVNIIDVEGNKLVRYWSQDGVVFDKGSVDDQSGKSTVLFVPLAKTGSFTIPDSVETITSKAFYKSALSTIIIPASVKTIGSYAFSECDNLSVVTFLEPAAGADVNNLTIGAKAFSFDTNLTQINLPARLTSIALTRYNISGSDVSLLGAADGVDDAFYGTNLEAINVAAGTDTTYTSANGILFSDGGETLLYVPSAKNVGEYTVGSNVKTIADGAFVNSDTVTSLTIHNMLTSVGECAFYKCTKLTAVTFEGEAISTSATVGKYAFRESGVSTLTFVSGCAVTAIDEGAFMGTAITTLTVPSRMTTISKQAFKDCTSLATIQFTADSNNELTVGESAFDGCTSLTTIHLTAGITSFPGFDGCSSLNTITVDEANPNYASENGILYNKTKTTLCYYPKAREGAFTVPSTVTEIAESAFADNTAITSITIPATVTKIGKNAFKGCTNLTEVTFVNGDSDLEIADYAFANSGITSFTMPERAKTLGKYLFSETKSLNSVMLSNSMSEIPDYIFYKSSLATIYIPDNIVKIGEAAFAASDIETVRISTASNLETIGEDAFALTDSLTNIELPASVKTIGEEAFGQSALTTVTFATGSQLETIGDYAFAYSELTGIVIPKTVKTIGAYAFDGYYGTNLATVTFEAGGTEDLTIGVRAFRKCTSLTKLALPARTKIIYDNAFYTCSGLTSVTFADNGETSRLQTIGENAFYYCSSLESITIPKSVGNYTYDSTQKIGIGAGAFRYNSKLTTVTFEMGGDKLLSIGDYAFGSCSKLESITFPARLSNATALTSNLFAGYYSSDVPAIKTITIQSYDGAPTCDYVAVDNIIYNSDKTQIVYSPVKNEATVHIPETITAIPDNAFKNSSIAGVVFDHGDDDPLTIGDYAFYGCTNITTVTLAPSVKTLGSSAFANCTNLESVTLSKSFETFDTSAFSGCSKLTNISVAPDNTKYSAENGVLFNADKTTLLSYLSTNTAKEYTIPNTVTEIAESAFSGNTNLEKVTIPASVKLINDLAFFNCTNLKTVEFAKDRTENLVIGTAATSTYISYIGSNYNDYGANVFAYCTALETIELPEKTTSLGSGVFYNCTSLTSVSLPSTLATMGMETFYYCSNLETVTFADNCALNKIPEKTFYNCSKLTTIRIPAEVEKISFSSSYYGAFYYSGITSVTFEANSKLNEIGNYAFYGLSSLESIEIPASVTKIGYQAFSGCRSLTSITLPNAVESLDEKAFYGCSKATSLTIGSGLKTIGDLALYNLGGLNTITVDPANTYFKSSGNCLIGSDGKLLLGSNSSVIPNDGTVTAIANYAFYGCSELTTLSLPDGLLSIGYQVFDGCSKLTYTESGNAKYLGNTENPNLVLISATSTSITSCEINSATKFIYYQAFYNCSSLGSIIIPVNVISIGENAFYGCSNLLEVQNLSNLTITKGSADNGYVAKYALSVYGAGEQSSIKSTSDGFKYSVDGENVILVAYTGTETTITLPEKLEDKTYTIYAGIFAGNTTLVSVTIPEGVEEIPANAFNGCTSLTSVSLPLSLTSIGENAFYGCTSLTSITIPKNVTTLGNSAFDGCTGLTVINLNATIADFSSSYNNVFRYAGSDTDGVTLNIGADVTKIGKYLFYYGSSSSVPKFTNIVFAADSKCKEIADYAFYYLDYITTLVLPDSLTTIGYEAIDTCSKLEYLVIGKDVTSIGSYFFYSAYKVNAVYFKGTADELSNSIVNTYSYLSSKTKLFYSETSVSGGWHYVEGVPTAW